MKTFWELDLIAPLQQALTDEQYKTPTPIQEWTIPPALAGRDVLGCAQTGTGKTAAFALPILNRLGKQNRRAQANCPYVLVLAPTRELAIQIQRSFATYGRHLRLRHALVYGGVSQGSQVRAMNRGAHVVVATPGRLLDLMNQGYIDLSDLEVFVLDEADRMLDMGFLPDLKRIIRQLPQQRQSLFFSATMPTPAVQLAERLLTDPVRVNVTPKKTSLEAIQQRVMFVERKGKLSLLRNILMTDGVERALVFTKTKRTANTLTERLVRGDIKAIAIHGNKSQNARQRALEAFRNKEVQVLVATDVAARGIDIDGITHVVNFDLPVEPECYVHRIGRTGRAGSEGVAVTFCTGAEHREWRAIEKLIGQKVPPVSQTPRRQQTRTTPLPPAPDSSEPMEPQTTSHRSSGTSNSPQSTSKSATPRPSTSKPVKSKRATSKPSTSRRTSSKRSSHPGATGSAQNGRPRRRRRKRDVAAGTSSGGAVRK